MKFNLRKQSDTVYFFHQVLIEPIKANNCFIHTPQPLQAADTARRVPTEEHCL